ncbi:MAG TPA: hypothetical protein VIH99_10740 [Bdellovibrionota bacterium]|jgi:hypothetical protein
MRYGIAALTLLWALPRPAHAEVKRAVACETLESLENRVEYCSDNKLAMLSAVACHEALVKAIHEGAPELASIFKAGEKNDVSRQMVKFQFSRSDYVNTEAKLTRLIDQTTRNMHLIAAYPTIMPDDLLGLGNVPCFTENYDPIVKSVRDLDEKITELKKAREAAVQLGKLSGDRQENVGSLNPDSLVRSEVYAAGSKPQVRSPSGHSPRKTSDITGIRENKLKELPQDEILNSFPARGQLEQ